MDMMAIAGRQSVSTVVTKDGDTPTVELWVNREPAGEIRPAHWLQPGHSTGISIGPTQFLIWSGYEFWSRSLASGSLRHQRCDEPVWEAYQVGRLWLVVCELTLLLFDAEAGVPVDRFFLSDILLERYWEDDYFFIKEWDGRRFRFFLPPTATELRPEPLA